MKLNNKGFAFTTLLYGVLALIVIVLYGVLSVQSNSSSETYYYGEVIKQKLDDCVSEEVELENCYSLVGNGGCNDKQNTYNACLGVATLANLLNNSVTTVGPGLYHESGTLYVFKGDNPSNFIKQNNVLYRIISIDQKGSVQITQNLATDSSWDIEREKGFSDYQVISSNVEIQSGSGTRNNPYIIE